MMTNEGFTTRYVELRKKEKRIYSDAEVLELPSISAGHPHYKEWRLRKRSCDQLLRYIRRKGQGLDILDVGCGNGWLTAQLAGETSGDVTGIDINKTELAQAKRIFANIRNCHFIETDIRSGTLGDKKFDMIVFAASIQYFRHLKEIITVSLEHLTLQGEIHIIDSRLYQYMEIAGAQERSRAYYESIGFPEMADHYFHHFIDNLAAFSHKILYDPSSWWQKLSFGNSPFHWIVVKNCYH